MRKKDLETLPPGVAVILKDVMHRCREEPLSNWPADIYELVDRQDLAGLEKHSLPEKQTDHLENGKSYAIKDDDPDQDDGMDFDDTVNIFLIEKNIQINCMPQIIRIFSTYLTEMRLFRIF